MHPLTTDHPAPVAQRPPRNASADRTGAAAGSARASQPVSLIGITKQYGDNVVLKPLDLEIRAGELLSLLGPSGCGKTTTLRILAGFVTPDGGTVRLGGQDVTDVPPNLRGLGMVFQSYSLFPHMTVAENVAFGLKMHGVAASARQAPVQEMLDVVRLSEFGGRYPAQLSGGQQQRVALARALVTRPSVLLLDEPLAALDKNLRERMQFEIRDLQRRLGITTVLVTHDQEEALTMSDRVAVMSRGELVQIGEPSEIYARPRTRFVSEFLGTSNLFAGVNEGRDADGTVQVRLDVSGRVSAGTAAQGAQYPQGGRTMIAVRPEKLLLQDAGAGGIVCTVKSCIFRGSYYVYELEAPGAEAPVIAFSQAPHAEAQPGSRVGVAWQPQHAVALVD